MKLPYTIFFALLFIVFLLAGCAPAQRPEVKETTPVEQVTRGPIGGGVYVFCWDGLQFMHVSNNSLIQVKNVNGIPMRCRQ